jgi:hypothetical protein
MAIIQALFALISKSAGKILNAIFGWAVHALFGKTTSREQTILSALVGAAAAWPLLAVGVAAPKVAALALAFVPIPHSVPAWIVRLVWLALALIVPLAVGLVVAKKRPESAPSGSLVVNVLRGFPLTLGLALAFLVMFVSVPVMRLVALARRQKSADVPLVTDAAAYHEVAARVVETLTQHGFELRKAEPSWWVKAPMRLLSWFGGDAFAGLVPVRLEHYAGRDIEISFYMSGVLLKGKGARATWAHGLIAETAIQTRGLETFAPAAQDLERQIRETWRAWESAGSPNSGAWLPRLEGLVDELGRLDAQYDEWQLLYRQLLQLERAVRGERQLMDRVAGTAGKTPQEAVAAPTRPREAEVALSPTMIGAMGLAAAGLVTWRLVGRRIK